MADAATIPQNLRCFTLVGGPHVDNDPFTGNQRVVFPETGPFLSSQNLSERHPDKFREVFDQREIDRLKKAATEGTKDTLTPAVESLTPQPDKKVTLTQPKLTVAPLETMSVPDLITLAQTEEVDLKGSKDKNTIIKLLKAAGL